MLLAVICYDVYIAHPESIHQAWDFVNTWTSFIYRVVFGIVKGLFQLVMPTGYCQDDEQSASSSSKATSSWFGWGFFGSKSSTSSSTKKDGFIRTIASKAKITSDQCDANLKQGLDTIHNQPLTPRRDAMRTKHAWEMHKECKGKVNIYFDLLHAYGPTLKEQTPSTYGTYDIKHQKVEVKYESGK